MATTRNYWNSLFQRLVRESRSIKAPEDTTVAEKQVKVAESDKQLQRSLDLRSQVVEQDNKEFRARRDRLREREDALAKREDALAEREDALWGRIKEMNRTEENAIAPPQDVAPPQDEDAPLQEEDAPPSNNQENEPIAETTKNNGTEK